MQPLFLSAPHLPPVSNDQENLILVNEEDTVLGYLPKKTCHEGQGILHRAFSVFLFNSQQELLLQQRSLEKMLWPGYWANSCCSHPRRHESIEEAAHRRTQEELGVRVALRFVYRFVYQASYLQGSELIGSEYELCSVFVGELPPHEQIKAHPQEISAVAFCRAKAIDAAVSAEPSLYAPWFLLEWSTLRQQYWSEISLLV